MWTTGATGDGAAVYTQFELFSWLNRTHLVDQFSQGIVAGYANSLKANTALTASPVTIDTGAAYVCGIPYINDAIKSFTVSTPVTGTTGYNLVLRADYTAQTVRLVLKASADGTAAPPALTQSLNSLMEISLYTFTITTGGVIGSWVDTRSLIYPDGFMKYYSLTTTFGGTTLTSFPKLTTPLVMLMGTVSVPTGSSAAVNFPASIGGTPLVFVTPVGLVGAGGNFSVNGVSSTGFTVNNAGSTVNCNWMAILQG